MRRIVLSCLAGLALCGAGRSWLIGQEPPLPEWNESSTPIREDNLVPPTGSVPDSPDPGPVELPPIEQIPDLPDLPPLLPPSDGEPAPEMEDMPGLEKPKLPKADRGKPADPNAPQSLNSVTGTAVKWFTNPREARQISLHTERPMLFVFGGFGWSPACKALNNDLFTSQQFNDYARSRLVLTFCNVPTRSGGFDSTKVAMLKEINRFRKYLKVRSLPTMILFDGEGREIDRLVGYNFNRQLRPASLAKAIERIARITNDSLRRVEERNKHRETLMKVQDFRWWKSTAGSKLFARLVGGATIPAPTEENPDATEPGAALMDENNHTRRVPFRQLAVEDREIARREVAKRNPPPEEPYPPEASSASPAATTAPNAPGS